MAEFWQAKVLAWLTWTKSLFFWPNVDLHKWLGWLGKVSSDFGALCPSYQNLIIRLISCVNLLVNLRSMCLKVPTCIESFVILVAKVFSFLCVSFICISKSTQKENKFQKITARWRGILVLLFKTPDEKKVGTSEAVKRLTSCVNFHGMCFKAPTWMESLFPFVAELNISLSIVIFIYLRK